MGIEKSSIPNSILSVSFYNSKHLSRTAQEQMAPRTEWQPWGPRKFTSARRLGPNTNKGNASASRSSAPYIYKPMQLATVVIELRCCCSNDNSQSRAPTGTRTGSNPFEGSVPTGMRSATAARNSSRWRRRSRGDISGGGDRKARAATAFSCSWDGSGTKHRERTGSNTRCPETGRSSVRKMGAVGPESAS